jgi:hypothetical protein
VPVTVGIAPVGCCAYAASLFGEYSMKANPAHSMMKKTANRILVLNMLPIF